MTSMWVLFGKLRQKDRDLAWLAAVPRIGVLKKQSKTPRDEITSVEHSGWRMKLSYMTDIFGQRIPVEREPEDPDRTPEYDEGNRVDYLEREIRDRSDREAEEYTREHYRDYDQWSGHMY